MNRSFTTIVLSFMITLVAVSCGKHTRINKKQNHHSNHVETVFQVKESESKKIIESFSKEENSNNFLNCVVISYNVTNNDYISKIKINCPTTKIQATLNKDEKLVYNTNDKRKANQNDKQLLNLALSNNDKGSFLSSLKGNKDNTVQTTLAKVIKYKKSTILLLNGFLKEDINNKLKITKSYDSNGFVTEDSVNEYSSKKILSDYYNTSHKLYLELMALKK